MKFPSGEQKTEQYRLGGFILAETATKIGITLSEGTPAVWAGFMSNLAIIDDMFEANPEYFRAPDKWLDYLELPRNEEVLSATEYLFEASNNSQHTHDIKEYFSYRQQEATGTIDLLRAIEPIYIPQEEALWKQMALVAAIGIFIDSLRDAQEDSIQIPQFSAKELSVQAIMNAIKFIPQVKPKTWSALVSSGHHYGLNTYLLTRTK